MEAGSFRVSGVALFGGLDNWTADRSTQDGSHAEEDAPRRHRRPCKDRHRNALDVHLRKSPTEKINREAPTLAKAAAIAARISAENGGKPCLIYGITPDKMTVLVPMDMIAAARNGAAPAKSRVANAKKADKPVGGKRAPILEAAQNGKMPAAPNFSAPTHARFRKKLAELIAMAKAGDLKGLKAMEINPVSTSPKAMACYRDLCVIAIKARTVKRNA